MQHASAHQESAQNLEMSLREHLLAAGAPEAQQHSPYPPPPPTASNAGPTTENPYQGSNSGSPHDPHLDPNMGGHAIPYSINNNQHADNDAMQGTPKGKRELSTSKRAAQNRAAQRAFRQRKEGYIKKLEEQVKDYEQMEQNYRRLQNENFQLREYILNLQSRLLETKGDIPAAPAEMHLTGGPLGGGGAGEGSTSMRGESVESGDSEARDEARLQAAAAQAEARAQDAPMYNTRERGDDKAGAEGAGAS